MTLLEVIVRDLQDAEEQCAFYAQRIAHEAEFRRKYGLPNPTPHPFAKREAAWRKYRDELVSLRDMLERLSMQDLESVDDMHDDLALLETF